MTGEHLFLEIEMDDLVLESVRNRPIRQRCALLRYAPTMYGPTVELSNPPPAWKAAWPRNCRGWQRHRVTPSFTSYLPSSYCSVLIVPEGCHVVMETCEGNIAGPGRHQEILLGPAMLHLLHWETSQMGISVRIDETSRMDTLQFILADRTRVGFNNGNNAYGVSLFADTTRDWIVRGRLPERGDFRERFELRQDACRFLQNHGVLNRLSPEPDWLLAEDSNLPAEREKAGGNTDDSSGADGVPGGSGSGDYAGGDHRVLAAGSGSEAGTGEHPSAGG